MRTLPGETVADLGGLPRPRFFWRGFLAAGPGGTFCASAGGGIVWHIVKCGREKNRRPVVRTMPYNSRTVPLRVLGTGETGTVLPPPIKDKDCKRCPNPVKKRPNPTAIIQQPQQVGLHRYTKTDDRLAWLDQYLGK